MDRLRLGLVGYGYWGPNLARNFHQLPEAWLVACADADNARLAEAARLYALQQTANDARALIENPTLDALVIATPARSHFELVSQALNAGKHVLVEKPLALTSADARALTDLAQKNKRVLMVGHTFEYNPAVWKIQELLDAGALGELYYIYANRVNLGRVQTDINALWSIAPHDVSIMLALLKQMPLSVSAHGATYLHQGIEDVVFALLNFPNNIVGHIHASWLDPSKTRQMTFVGSEKMIVYDDVDPEAKLKIYDKGVYKRGDAFGEFQLRVRSGDLYIPKIDLTEPLKYECAHFLECIRDNKTPRTDGENGLRVVRVLEAAQESLKQNGTPIQLNSMDADKRG
ncbi:MAG: Gfo/Idh/MocA family oxidoreductase [Chloroflexota bacterium]|nr:MAG: Gfo/Idh/MocA family oxidoreductase [Chloroflexota bacterium]